MNWRNCVSAEELAHGKLVIIGDLDQNQILTADDLREIATSVKTGFVDQHKTKHNITRLTLHRVHLPKLVIAFSGFLNELIANPNFTSLDLVHDNSSHSPSLNVAQIQALAAVIGRSRIQTLKIHTMDNAKAAAAIVQLIQTSQHLVTLSTDINDAAYDYAVLKAACKAPRLSQLQLTSTKQSTHTRPFPVEPEAISNPHLQIDFKDGTSINTSTFVQVPRSLLPEIVPTAKSLDNRAAHGVASTSTMQTRSTPPRLAAIKPRATTPQKRETTPQKNEARSKALFATTSLAQLPKLSMLSGQRRPRDEGNGDSAATTTDANATEASSNASKRRRKGL